MWTDEEVAELARKGNDHCRRTWLKNAPPPGTGGRPAPGMDINLFKKFVIEAYEYKRYYGEDDGADTGAQPMPRAAPPPPAPAAPPQRRVMPRAAPAPAPVPPPAPVMDLLDFGATTTTPASAPSATPAAANVNLFQANFDAAPAPPTQPAVTNSNNLFAAPKASDVPVLSKPAPAAPAPAPSTSGGGGIADFAGLMAGPSTNTMSNAGTSGKKPIMGNGSALAGMPPTQQQQPVMMGMSNMVGAPMNMNMNMNPQLMMQQQQQMMQQMMMMQQQQQGGVGGGGGGGFGQQPMMPMMMMNNNTNNAMGMMPSQQQQQPRGGGFGTAMNTSMGSGNATGMAAFDTLSNQQQQNQQPSQQQQQQHQQQQQQQKLSMNSMPGGDVFSTMNMFK